MYEEFKHKNLSPLPKKSFMREFKLVFAAENNNY